MHASVLVLLASGHVLLVARDVSLTEDCVFATVGTVLHEASHVLLSHGVVLQIDVRVLESDFSLLVNNWAILHYKHTLLL